MEKRRGKLYRGQLSLAQFMSDLAGRLLTSVTVSGFANSVSLEIAK